MLCGLHRLMAEQFGHDEEIMRRRIRHHGEYRLQGGGRPFPVESRESALDKAEQVAAEMRSRRLRAAANCLREGVGETTTYLLDEFPDGHRRRIRTNNMIERLNREIRRRTRVVGGFPDGNSALMLVCARIRYVTANEWSTRRYLDMSRFDDNLVEAN